MQFNSKSNASGRAFLGFTGSPRQRSTIRNKEATVKLKMLTYSTAILLLALQNSNGYMTRRSDIPDCPGAGYTVRRTFLEEHNTRRALLANGSANINGKQMPSAANMRFMGYDCKLEEEAKNLPSACEGIPETWRFNETKTNFALIKSHKDNGEISAPGEMAEADEDKVGCSVRSCKKAGSDASYYSVACVYGKGVEADKNLYEEGVAGSKCTEFEGYEEKEALCKKRKQKKN
ncbi:unnamed protein product [Haemonchus placei]|uniref:SCP domain-containing protein n=1 Tax=Haemonchus placei TaxID=6290 RepID=A0A0N4X7C2_HAEPC|nr:unnamed protein product [Haemonchus placei]